MAKQNRAFLKQLGARIKRLRQTSATKLSQELLAHNSGVVTYTISKIESGLVDARIDTLRAIAKALGVSLVEVLDDLEPAQPGKLERRAINKIAKTLGTLDLAAINEIATIVDAAANIANGRTKRRRTRS